MKGAFISHETLFWNSPNTISSQKERNSRIPFTLQSHKEPTCRSPSANLSASVCTPAFCRCCCWCCCRRLPHPCPAYVPTKTIQVLFSFCFFFFEFLGSRLMQRNMSCSCSCSYSCSCSCYSLLFTFYYFWVSGRHFTFKLYISLTNTHTKYRLNDGVPILDNLLVNFMWWSLNQLTEFIRSLCFLIFVLNPNFSNLINLDKIHCWLHKWRFFQQ